MDEDDDEDAFCVKVIRSKSRKYLMLRWWERPLPTADDPFPKKKLRQKSAGTNNEAVARRKANDLAYKLSNGTYGIAAVSWEHFCERYEQEHLIALKPSTAKAWKTCKAMVRRTINPTFVRDVNALSLGKMVAKLLEGDGNKHPPIAVTSIDSYLGQLGAALSWGKDPAGLIKEMPRFPRLPRAKGRSKLARSRPITLEELDRILEATEKVRGLKQRGRQKWNGDVDQWKHFIRGLAESGLRISEALRLTWDYGDGFYMDVRGRRPVIRISGDAEKAHTDRIQPITPEFWNLIQPQRPSGRVLPLVDKRGRSYGLDWVMHVIAEIGEKAGVITSPDEKKHATSHDIGRRLFATRMASKMTPAELKDWMRHASVETTLRYYAIQDAQTLAERFWTDDAKGDTSPRKRSHSQPRKA